MSLVLVLAALALGCVAMPTMSSFSGTSANPTSNFSAAASFGCTPATLNPVWMTGFEHGVTTAATGSGLMDIDL
jgi:ABC-type sugar transport system substrate-binding protein